jgi:hypothetical protein
VPQTEASYRSVAAIRSRAIPHDILDLSVRILDMKVSQLQRELVSLRRRNERLIALLRLVVSFQFITAPGLVSLSTPQVGLR